AALERIVPAIRQRCHRARIVVRGDSGFGGEEILAWCEGQREVYYCLGLAKNPVLTEKLGPMRAAAQTCGFSAGLKMLSPLDDRDKKGDRGLACRR
ncbi:MAG: transposase, partial [Planctomycetota bacterium]